MTNRPDGIPFDGMSGIRRMTDADRTPELKEKRDEIVRKIGSTLDALSVQAAAGEPLPNGMLIRIGEGLVQHTIQDPLEERPRFNLGYTIYPEPGAYLHEDDWGNRKFTLVEPTGRVVELEDNGLERSLYGPESGYSTTSSTLIARFMEQDTAEKYTEGSIDASGEFKHRYFDESIGYHVGNTITTVGSVSAQSEHLDQLIAELLPVEPTATPS